MRKNYKYIFRVGIILLGIFFTLLSMSGCIFSPTLTGGISGTATDNQSGKPLAGVLVSAGNVSTDSDYLGNYILNKVPVGNREVTAVLKGYYSQTETVEIIENEIIELDFQLIPLSQENQRVVMVELYMGIGCHNCELVEPILEQLVVEYGYDQMVLVEEAVNWSEYTTPEISERYDWYFPPGSADRGIPNILFNGLNENWIHGYANYQTIKSKIDAEIAKGTRISINTSRSSNTSSTTISGTIENISDSTLSNLEINGMVFKERQTVNLKYSVFDIFEEQKVEITSLAPEEILNFSFTLEGVNWDSENLHGAIFVQAPDSPTKEILQAAYVE
ncbi:carboxypeptidase-like regulatory domain-containing protein [bacterium]|nr:carboxypeptidase-like regulatory domain-containing protein [bacterium]MBU4510035.1 carboxypeptidase-like regulatory domain-containing protein [bacterium]